jgi:hypothetical protein
VETKSTSQKQCPCLGTLRANIAQENVSTMPTKRKPNVKHAEKFSINQNVEPKSSALGNACSKNVIKMHVHIAGSLFQKILSVILSLEKGLSAVEFA